MAARSGAACRRGNKDVSPDGCSSHGRWLPSRRRRWRRNGVGIRWAVHVGGSRQTPAPVLAVAFPRLWWGEGWRPAVRRARSRAAGAQESRVAQRGRRRVAAGRLARRRRSWTLVAQQHWLEALRQRASLAASACLANGGVLGPLGAARRQAACCGGGGAHTSDRPVRG